MSKLSDKQKKKIIADRVNGMTFKALSLKYHVSTTTIQRVLKEDPQLTKKVIQKKEQNELDMLAYLDSRSASAQEFIDMALAAIKDPTKLDKASVQTIATAMGIVIDKFLQTKPKNDDEGVTIIWG